MINKTVGVGGDFPNFFEVEVYLCNNGENLNSIDTQFKFTQISDITFTWSDYDNSSYWSSDFYNNYYAYPYISLSADVSIEVDGGGFVYDSVWHGIQFNTGNVADGRNYLSINIYNCDIRRFSDPNTLSDDGFCIRVGGNKSLTVHHNKISAPYYANPSSALPQYGIYTEIPLTGPISIYSNLIYNLGFDGIFLQQISVNPATPPTASVENNTIYRCGTREYYGLEINGNDQYGDPLSNIVSVGCRNNAVLNSGASGVSVYTTESLSTFKNCAATGSILPEEQSSDCILGVTAATELVSITITDSDFLRPSSSSSLRSGGIAPLVATTDFEYEIFGAAYPIGALQNVAPVKSQPISNIFVAINSARALILGSKVTDDAGTSKLQMTSYKGRSDYQDVLINGGA